MMIADKPFIIPGSSYPHTDIREEPNLAPGSYVLLRVRDTGRGMAPEVMEHIFDPYFTTKSRGNSYGIRKFMMKPVGSRQLAEAVREALGGRKDPQASWPDT